MTDIYVDAALASESRAVEHLVHLIDAGQRVILTGTPGAGAVAGLADIPRLDRIPARPAAGSWFVTADPARCRERIAGVRTLLIGPRVPRTQAPGPRCDVEARDLAAAVLAILAHDAMGT
jgi:hypothetical protein